MKRKVLLILMNILLVSLVGILQVQEVYATASVTILPSSASVGKYRTIMIYIKAEDPPATGVEKVELVAQGVPNGVKIGFNPQYVMYTNNIESTMYVYAGPDSTAGTYTITVVAYWYNELYPWIPRWNGTAPFSLEIKAATGNTWTENPNLQNPYPIMEKWAPSCFRFPLGQDGSVTENGDSVHFCNWNTSGRVDMKATDYPSLYINWGEASQFYQTPSKPLYLDPQLSITYKAAVENYGQVVYGVGVADFTGIKFDAWATNLIDQRDLYVEMYFLKGGWNDAWIVYEPYNGIEVKRTLGANIDDYMVYIVDGSFAGEVLTETSGPTTYFTIDLSYFLKRACELHGKNIQDYKLKTVGPCMEAFSVDGIAASWASFTFVQVENCNSADINYDGQVDSADYNLVSGALGEKLGDSGYLPIADVNQDKKINKADLDSIDLAWTTQIQLREFDYAASYNPNIRFYKPYDGILRMDSYSAGSGSIGRGYAFFKFRRDMLQNRKIRTSWNVYHSYADPRDLDLATVYVFDTAFDRRDLESYFKPNLNREPIFDYTNVKAFQYPFQHKADWNGWFQNTSGQLALSSWASEYVTIVIRLVDNWVGDTVILDVDYLQILDASNNVLYDLQLRESVRMEKVGTLDDWGIMPRSIGQMQLREFDYAASYNPDIRFLKPDSETLRMDSFTAGVSSLGKGYVFLVIRRDTLNGMKIKMRWNVYYDYADSRDLNLAAVYALNAGLDRRDMDNYFKPNLNREPIFDYTNVKALQYPFQHRADWNGYFETTSGQLVLSSWTSEYVTIVIRMCDDWNGNKVGVDIDYLQILDASDNVVFSFQFRESVAMETSGTLNDYGITR